MSPAVANRPAGARADWSQSRGRRISVRALIATATIVGILGIVASWSRTQLLDTGQWTKTSTELLANRAVRSQVATYLTDQLYANVNVAGELGRQLPSDLKPLAALAAGSLRQPVEQVAERALARPRVQSLWADANRVAHRTFVRIVDGGTANLQTTGGVVRLDLKRILTQVGASVGVPTSLTDRIPAQAASIQILRSDQLRQAQDGVALLRTVAVLLGIVSLLLYVAAVWLAVGHRRETLKSVGLSVIVVGLAVLLVRQIAGGEIVNSLVSDAAVRPAANAVWGIATSLLVTLAIQAIVIGAGIVVASLVAGPSRWATRLRLRLAPTLRDRPEATWLALAAFVLLLVAWAPFPAARRPLFLLILTGFLILGLVTLRRIAVGELVDGGHDPSAEPTSHALAGLRHRMAAAPGEARAALAGARTALTPDERPTALTVGAAGADRLDLLERLATLRDRGALSDEEFDLEKTKLLGPEGSRTPPATPGSAAAVPDQAANPGAVNSKPSPDVPGRA